MKTRVMKTRLWLLASSMVSSFLLFTACQSGPPQITIEGESAELSPAVVGEAMIGMKIVNRGGADELTAVKTDIPGASTMFHIMDGERMAMVETVKIPSKSTVEFKMGGSHIMIENMPKTISEGSQFTVTLVFAKSGEKQILLTLKSPSKMNMGHEHHM
jgi:copper(I)-binding protein